VFEQVAGVVDADAKITAPTVVFHPASGIDEAAVAQAQADLRRRILRAFVGRGLIERCDAKDMLAYQHSGFSVNAGVCIEAHDRAALERLLRYCARPPLLILTPLELIDRIAALVPQGSAVSPKPEPVSPKRAPAHYLWAVLIARIYEVFPLLCPLCGGQMRLIAFITEGTQISRILEHIGVDSEPPRISPARGPPLWEDGDAPVGEGVEIEPDWDTAAQPAPDFDVDQRVNW